MIEFYQILKYPVSTEKAVRLMESENKLTFIVDGKVTKAQIRKAIEELFKVKVLKINTLNTMKGKKKAYIKLSQENPAIDIATQFGLM